MQKMILKCLGLKNSSKNHAIQMTFKKLLFSLTQRAVITIICADTKRPPFPDVSKYEAGLLTILPQMTLSDRRQAQVGTKAMCLYKAMCG